jgi:UDP-N-acetylglucosamine:LPS N-acetylglucosamine transferase
MKICILTGKFGMGHLSASMALKQQIEDSSLNAEVEVIDWLQYVSPRLAEKYYLFFTLLVNKGSGLYNTRYRFLENKKTDQKPELSHYFLWCFSKFMEEKKPDLIISTVPICSQIVSRYKERYACAIPLVTCVTDITGHSEWISKNTELYLVGSRTVREKFLMKGVPAEKIHETGIPVRSEFISSVNEKGYENHCKKKLLIMGGGLGILPENPQFYEKLSFLPNTDITLITGKNTKLLQHLSGKYPNIRVLGFVNNIYDYMKQADAIITKPGGISTFEAIQAEVPILAIKPFLQQEIYNAQYIEEMQLGTVIDVSSSNCIEDITSLLETRQLNLYRNNIRKLKRHLEYGHITSLLTEALIQSSYSANYSYLNMYKLKREGHVKHEKISFNL